MSNLRRCSSALLPRALLPRAAFGEGAKRVATSWAACVGKPSGSCCPRTPIPSRRPLYRIAPYGGQALARERWLSGIVVALARRPHGRAGKCSQSARASSCSPLSSCLSSRPAVQEQRACRVAQGRRTKYTILVLRNLLVCRVEVEDKLWWWGRSSGGARLGSGKARYLRISPRHGRVSSTDQPCPLSPLLLVINLIFYES